MTRVPPASRRRTVAAVVGALLLLAAAGLHFFELRLPSRPWGDVEDLASLAHRDDLNLVLILVDTLRADHLWSYGYERETDPFLKQVADTGVRFDRVRSQSSWTKTSMASLWTGSHPGHHGILTAGDVLPDAREMPAEILRESGFQTAGIFRNGWVAPNFGFSQGFDLYFRPVPGIERRRAGDPQRSAALGGSDFDATRTAIEFLEANQGERFFLYLHYMDVHQFAYEEESALFGTSIEDAYDNAIHWTDECRRFKPPTRLHVR